MTKSAGPDQMPCLCLHFLWYLMVGNPTTQLKCLNCG